MPSLFDILEIKYFKRHHRASSSSTDIPQRNVCNFADVVANAQKNTSKALCTNERNY